MDVSYVVAALRRHGWIVLVGTSVGVLVALSLGLWTRGPYESRVRLSIRPPIGANIFYPDPDSYLAAEIEVLRSDGMARAVAERQRASGVGDVSESDVRRGVSIEHDPSTDLVTIVAIGDDPESTRVLATTFATTYVDAQATSAVDESLRGALEAEAAELERELQAIDEQIRTAMAPYLRTGDQPTEVTAPTPEMVVPGELSRRRILQTRLDAVTWELVEVLDEGRIQVNTTVLGEATPPELRPFRIEVDRAAAIPIGAVAGIAGALAAARADRRVLDAREIETILGATIAASLGHVPRWSGDLRGALAPGDAIVGRAVDRLCVLIADGRSTGGLLVAVTGAQRAAGASTLATAVAARLAACGRTVALVDADAHDPAIAAAFVPTPPGDAGASDGRLATAATDLDRLSVVVPARPMRLPGDVAAELAELDEQVRHGSLLVADCGPLLDSPRAHAVVGHADVVLVAVPGREQDRMSLHTLALALRGSTGKLLPVITSPVRAHRRGDPGA